MSYPNLQKFSSLSTFGQSSSKSTIDRLYSGSVCVKPAKADMATRQSTAESKFKTADRISQIQKVLANSHDYTRLIADSTERVETISILSQKSRTLVVATHTVNIREVSQLAVFIDETTVLIMTRLRVFQQATVMSNIDEVLKSLSELSGLLDSRFKRLEAMLAECLAAVGRVTGALTGSSRVRAVQSQLAALISKVPRIQAFLTRGMALIGKSLAALGLLIGAYQTYDKWNEWSENKSPENFKKAIIETIGFVIGIVLVIVAAFVGGIGAIVIGAVMLIYGIVDAYFSFKDPDHQDFIAQGLYAGAEALYPMVDTVMELTSHMKESLDRAIQKVKQYLHDLYLKLTKVVSEFAEKAEQKAVDLFDDLLLNLREPLF